MNILAIAPATKCGWAVSNQIYGCWDLSVRRDESNGMKLLRLRALLEKTHNELDLQLVVYERPAGLHANSIIHQAKLIAIIETFCEERNIQYRAYSASEIKKFATGKGNAKKEQMILFAKEKLDYSGDNDNEADALWLLNLVKKDLNI